MGLSEEVYDNLSSTTDLTEEIALCRANISRYSSMLGRGQEFIYSDPRGVSGIEKQLDDGATAQLAAGSRIALSVEDLLADSISQLRAMAKTQHDMRPGGDIGGNLKFTIEVMRSAGDAAEAAVPVLTEDDGHDTPPEDFENTFEPDDDTSEPLPSSGGYDD